MALPQLFSIGEMAKIFHLSVSSLRHYEALGLVTPEYVDPSTNYRQRVHELAEICDLIIVASDVAVGKVRQARNDKNAERPPSRTREVQVQHH